MLARKHMPSLSCTVGVIADIAVREPTPDRSQSLSLDMDADPSGLSPSAILATVSSQYVTYGTGEGDVRSCSSRARTG